MKIDISEKEVIAKINSYELPLDEVRVAKIKVLLLHWLHYSEKKGSDEFFSHVKEIKSPHCFNIALINIIEHFVKNGDLDSAQKHVQFYRINGLAELAKVHLFRARHISGGNFDHILRQCTYLEKINRGNETNEDFQRLFNPEIERTNLSLDEFPRNARTRREVIDKIVEILKEKNI